MFPFLSKDITCLFLLFIIFITTSIVPTLSTHQEEAVKPNGQWDITVLQSEKSGIEEGPRLAIRNRHRRSSSGGSNGIVMSLMALSELVSPAATPNQQQIVLESQSQDEALFEAELKVGEHKKEGEKSFRITTSRPIRSLGSNSTTTTEYVLRWRLQPDKDLGEAVCLHWTDSNETRVHWFLSTPYTEADSGFGWPLNPTHPFNEPLTITPRTGKFTTALEHLVLSSAGFALLLDSGLRWTVVNQPKPNEDPKKDLPSNHYWCLRPRGSRTATLNRDRAWFGFRILAAASIQAAWSAALTQYGYLGGGPRPRPNLSTSQKLINLPLVGVEALLTEPKDALAKELLSKPQKDLVILLGSNNAPNSDTISKLPHTALTIWSVAGPRPMMVVKQQSSDVKNSGKSAQENLHSELYQREVSELSEILKRQPPPEKGGPHLEGVRFARAGFITPDSKASGAQELADYQFGMDEFLTEYSVAAAQAALDSGLITLLMDHVRGVQRIRPYLTVQVSEKDPDPIGTLIESALTLSMAGYPLIVPVMRQIEDPKLTSLFRLWIRVAAYMPVMMIPSFKGAVDHGMIGELKTCLQTRTEIVAPTLARLLSEHQQKQKQNLNSPLLLLRPVWFGDSNEEAPESIEKEEEEIWKDKVLDSKLSRRQFLLGPDLLVVVFAPDPQEGSAPVDNMRVFIPSAGRWDCSHTGVASLSGGPKFTIVQRPQLMEGQKEEDRVQVIHFRRSAFKG